MRLIDADKLINHLCDYASQESDKKEVWKAILKCVDAVREQPTVSVEVWTGYHGGCLQPKGSFEKCYKDALEREDEDDI